MRRRKTERKVYIYNRTWLSTQDMTTQKLLLSKYVKWKAIPYFHLQCKWTWLLPWFKLSNHPSRNYKCTKMQMASQAINRAIICLYIKTCSIVHFAFNNCLCMLTFSGFNFVCGGPNPLWKESNGVHFVSFPEDWSWDCFPNHHCLLWTYELWCWTTSVSLCQH